MPHRLTLLFHLAPYQLTFAGSFLALGSAFWAVLEPPALPPYLMGLSSLLMALVPLVREWRRDRDALRTHDAQMAALRSDLGRLKVENDRLKAGLARDDKRITQITDAAARSGMMPSPKLD